MVISHTNAKKVNVKVSWFQKQSKNKWTDRRDRSHYLPTNAVIKQADALQTASEHITAAT